MLSRVDPLGGGDLASAEGILLGETTGDELGAALAVLDDASSPIFAVGAPGSDSGAGLVYMMRALGSGIGSVAVSADEITASSSSAALGVCLFATGDASGGAIWIGGSGADVGAAGAGSVYQLSTESFSW